MAGPTVTPSVLPGQALPPQDLTFTFRDDIEQVIITTGPTAPVYSKTLGFDYGPVPGQGDNVKRPFMAVTQDGRGNVYYDGGYLKYLDMNNKYAPDVTFDALNGAIKLLVNAIKWAGNVAKVATGNKKILILGNGTNGTEYDIISPANPVTQTSNATLRTACRIAGFEPTIKNITSYGGSRLDPTVTELAQYSAVIIVSMNSQGVPSTNTLITEAGAAALEYNRTIGTGMIMLTDHCNAWYTSLADASARLSGYPVTTQAISSKFGTWFTGNVDRNPALTVGDLIANSGDHPLFKGIPRDQKIGADLSESLVMVEERVGVPPDQVQPIKMDKAGEWMVNVLTIAKDGGASYVTYRYFIIDSGDTNIVDRDGNIVRDNRYVTGSRVFQFGIKTANPDYQNMQGIVTRNYRYMGSFNYVNGVTELQWPDDAQGSFISNPGDVIGFQVQQPFFYNLYCTIVKPTYPDPSQPASLMRAVRNDFGPPTGDAAYKTASDTAWRFFRQPEDPAVKPFWLPKQNALVNRLYTGQLSPAVVRTYATEADFRANPPTSGVVESYAVIIRNTLKVFVWRNIIAGWSPLSSGTVVNEIAALYGLGRRIRDSVTNQMYLVEANQFTPV